MPALLVLLLSWGLLQPRCEGETVDGLQEGLWKCYYEDGQLQQSGTYQAGHKVGLWQLYHANGILAAEGHYRNDSEEGEWVFYDETGKVIFRNNYGNGE